MSQNRALWSSDLAYWLRLEQTEGIGPRTARRLLEAFGLPGNIFSSSPIALGHVVPPKIVLALLAPLSELARLRIEAAWCWAQQKGNRILTLADNAYPANLLNIPDPPLLLYVKGRAELLARPALAIVGSRNATLQGVAHAERFSEVLSERGLTIISGLALGIDSAAHKGALGHSQKPDSGSTVAVIGTGADIVYPARNLALAHEIAHAGCIVSEYRLGTAGVAANFPRRNRIISGLSSGVLVVEAAARSGSLITARMAAEQGREVFAIPGSIHAPLSKGCHQLIKQGAKLVESAQDILEELTVQHPLVKQAERMVPAVTRASEVSELVLAALGYDPANIDLLAVRCDMDVAVVSAELLRLELEGMVELLAGGTYRRIVI